MKRVLIVEDIAETRIWLSELTKEAFPDCLIDEARDVRSANTLVADNRYDLAMIDLGLPDGSGLDVLRKVVSTVPETLCVVTTVLAEDGHIVSALSAGAHGYLLKDQPSTLLSQQLRQLQSGIPALTPTIAVRIMDHFRRTGPMLTEEHDLTAREAEVLGLIGRGMRNGEVANALSISENTVASHVKSAYRKLDISCRAEAAWHARRLGLTPEV